MTEKIRRQFGLWDSPISPQGLAGNRRLESAQWDSDGQTLVWLEGRSGRGVLVAQSADGNAPRDLTTDLNVRGGVGYGGGDFTLHHGIVYFTASGDGRLFRQSLDSRQSLDGGAARPITQKFGGLASPTISPDGRWAAYVHHDGKATDCIAIVDTEGKQWSQIFVGGNDFYMQPRWSPDGRQFCWVTWNHPQMPWDGTTLFIADVIVDDDLTTNNITINKTATSGSTLPRLGTPRKIAGGENVAIFQPEFTPDGQSLIYISDETGWGRLCVTELNAKKSNTAEINAEKPSSRWLTPLGVEHGWPAWVQEMRTFAVLPDGKSVIAARSENGMQRLVEIDLQSGDEQLHSELDEYAEINHLQTAPHSRQIVFAGSGPKITKRIVLHTLNTGNTKNTAVTKNKNDTKIVARSSGETVSEFALADCESVQWETTGGEIAHGLFYAPTNDRFVCETGLPPVVVHIHGGPTSQATAGWNANAQFFATRGYAVLLVNYRGSTGYGRDYMLRLRNNWGVCDVDDAITGLQFLADTQRADRQKSVIMGGSAGGLTVLQTLSQYPESFTAGISLYGVANQFHLVAETHKFEAHYNDTLVGSLPEAAQIYHDRSPEFHADKIIRPLAIFQGEKDTVVPKAQSEAIANALSRNGTPHIYHCYKGEGHGWRKQETIEHFYKTVDAFLRQHLIYTC